MRRRGEENDEEEEEEEVDEEEEKGEQKCHKHIECLSDSPRTALRRFLEASWGVWGASSQAQWRF